MHDILANVRKASRLSFGSTSAIPSRSNRISRVLPWNFQDAFESVLSLICPPSGSVIERFSPIAVDAFARDVTSVRESAAPTIVPIPMTAGGECGLTASLPASNQKVRLSILLHALAGQPYGFGDIVRIRV